MKNITKATINSIIRNGGATINSNGERVQLKSGYQVSKCDLLIIPVEELNKYLDILSLDISDLKTPENMMKLIMEVKILVVLDLRIVI